jgi:hypothetical protein
MTHDPISHAANVISFPSNKITFKAVKIDANKVMANYDYNRRLVLFAIKILTLRPKKLRQSVLKIGKTIEDESVARLIADFENLSEDFFPTISDVLAAAAARLIAVDRNLI